MFQDLGLDSTSAATWLRDSEIVMQGLGRWMREQSVVASVLARHVDRSIPGWHVNSARHVPSSMTESDAEGFLRQVTATTAEDVKLQQQAAANSEEQFLNSPDLKPEVVQALLTATDNFAPMSGETLDSDRKMAILIRLVGRLLHEDGNAA